jgi:acetoacetyl-CoA synthase
MSSCPNVGILGTGSYLPAQAVPNSVVAARAGCTEEWILRKTGVRSRHYAADHEAASDLATDAARQALTASGIAADELSWIVLATSTPDHPQPPTACLVQDRLGATKAAAFDINAVCAGFIFALVTAHSLLSGTSDYALVIGTDVYSRIIDPADRRTSVLFGDGAGAAVLGPVRSGHGVLGARLSTLGQHHDMIYVEAGGSRSPASEKTLAEGLHSFRMDGRAVREFVAAELPRAIRQLLAAHEVGPDLIDHFIPHQANGVLLAEIFPALGMERAQMRLTVADHGNTSAASIPLALDDAWRAGALKDGDLIVLAGFGGGMSLGSALVRWDGERACTT